MSTRIQLRRDTAANWTAEDTLLESGEVGYETDTGRFKIGNGSDPWTSRPYAGGAAEYADISDTSAVLDAVQAMSALGTAGQVPQVNSGATGLEFVAGPAMKLIQTVSPGGGAACSFSSIPATYKDLLYVESGRATGGTARYNRAFIVNGDTGSNYDYHIPYTNGATVSNTSGAGSGSIVPGWIPGAGAPTAHFGTLRVHIYDYASTVKEKTMRIEGGMKEANATADLWTWEGTGIWRTTGTAINALAFSHGGGNYATDSVGRLYGILG